MSDCRHFREHGEGVEWPPDVALDHFLDCLGADLEVWARILHQSRQAAKCFLLDHEGQIADLEHRLFVKGRR